MIEPGSILSGLSNVTSVLATLNSLLKGSRGMQRALLLELEGNTRLILLNVKGGAPVEKVVPRLETSSTRKAMESGFNFNALKSGKVKPKTVGDSPQMQAYLGWSTEKLFANVYLKIRDLQHIVDIDATNDRFRTGVRLQNILKMMLLLVRHIRS
jgi:hypothetical protein